ncbi:SWIM zinc finger family protein [Streptomyces sp. NPDC086080]|uniref:SWIM zinc finger family protein n=1 Tax=Streptomyces sp. NPDC086080 TaxID=3365748 RepID=UPI0037D2ADD2
MPPGDGTPEGARPGEAPADEQAPPAGSTRTRPSDPGQAPHEAGTTGGVPGGAMSGEAADAGEPGAGPRADAGVSGGGTAAGAAEGTVAGAGGSEFREVSGRVGSVSGGRVVAGGTGTGPSGEGPSTGEARAGAGVSADGAVVGAGDHPVASGPVTDPGLDGADRPGRRPGDVAREALRSARAERARAQAEDRPRPTRRRAASPAPRVPRTTRGDRVADERAREVRAALADAFRMPTGADAPRPEPASDAGTRREGPSAPAPPARTGPVPPATPHPPHATPRSMAAPARDGELRRTFPAFPPRAGGGAGFAGTWWGGAWVTALEDGALDPARLARGRGYAEQGHVDAITVTPGLVLAYVRGSRPRPYRVQVRLRTFGDADWERFLDAAAERPGHIAALLDKEMPESLADCGVPLLPGPGDLDPRCSCPDSGHPCKHAAALCYQTARLLDADPFVLLLLRGRGEREVIDALSRLSAARAARAAREKEPEPLPGIRAAEVIARTDRELPPLPAPLPPPPHPQQPPAYPASPGGPDPYALDQLATDAAARAHALLTTGRDPVGGLTLWHDAVRLAAARPGSGLTAATRTLYSSLARAAGRGPAELARGVAAWRQGGPAGLAVLEEPWDPPAGRFDRARPLLLAADLPAFRPWRNRLTHPRGHVQLRLGRDHLWYAYESEPGHDDWWPRGTPDPDPVGALTGLDTPGAL